jgi:hypothetical protein
MDPTDARTLEVHEWQRYYGMEPRQDSRLTQLYSSYQTGSMGPDEVARELVAADFLHKQTLYGSLLEAFMRRVADEVRRRHPTLSWTATWEIVRFYAPIALKLMAVGSSGLRIPECPPAV